MSIPVRDNMMIFMLPIIVMIVCLASVFVLSYSNTVYSQPITMDSFSSNLNTDLKSKIDNLIEGKLNLTTGLLNSSNILANDSNLTSTRMIISNNKVMSMIGDNDSSSGNSMIKDKLTVTNGVCHSEKVGGNGDDILISSGDCDDQLTGGPGADKFTCGLGNDTVRDYNPEEGDAILDKDNCEKIL
jgi:hypothetical protein